MHHATLLVALRDGPSARAFRAALTAAGARVLDATSGPEALDRARREPPDLAILDGALPGTGGFELCARFRLGTLGARVPVLLVSSAPDADARARAVGADALLSHPLDPVDGVALVRALLRPAGSGPTRASPSPAPPSPLGRVLPVASDDEPEAPFLPQDLVPLLLQLHAEAWEGPVEIRAGPHRVRIGFQGGHPASVQGVPPASAAPSRLGDLLLELGLLDPEALGDAVTGARRAGRPLGRTLAAERLVDPEVLEHVLREQTLRRLVELRHLPAGGWRRSPAGLQVEEPGHPIHVAVAAWRLAGPQAPVPPVTDDELPAFMSTGPGFEEAWSFLDPTGRAAAIHLVLVGGGRVEDLLRVGGPRMRPLVALLRATGLLALVAEPPDRGRRAALLARADLSAFRARLELDHAATAGADAWSVLGLPPGSPPDAVEAAAGEILLRYRPTRLPRGLPPEDRRRAAQVHRQVLQARRVLTRARPQAVHDALLAAPDLPAAPPVRVPDHAVLQAEQARALLQRSDPAGAAALLEVALKLEGEDPDILVLLGRARRQAAGDPEAGEPETRRALALDPDHPCALVDLAGILRHRGDASGARACLSRALAADPLHGEARRDWEATAASHPR